MATGFMPKIIALFVLLACSFAARAAEVALIGVIGERAAVIAIDGGEPKTIKLGQTWNGIKVVAVEKTQATIEMDGRQRVLQLSQHYRGAPVGDSRQSATLAVDARGHFFTDAMVNDRSLRLMVDTGASVIVLSAADAARTGLEWRKSRSATVQTVNGPTTGYFVRLEKVKVGGIELSNVEGIVVEQGLGQFGLLGMSFLNRVEMRRDGDRMELIRRF